MCPECFKLQFFKLCTLVEECILNVLFNYCLEHCHIDNIVLYKSVAKTI